MLTGSSPGRCAKRVPVGRRDQVFKQRMPEIMIFRQKPVIKIRMPHADDD